ncbi:hypothetical protein [Pseudohalioglobus lutimaris]|uniref:Uncharacterized protein n=1 Tax=Pseudohalioglobus lutimaris TaxID=1737061 RepID=A0A2N5WZX4_9GAMM|nr:hypothetical protein [Pseudohalioglobus lutimaris]PLW67799.1 hypothetical protein C0039_15385 [Pseudohalioglobus lutimaris]
MPALRRKLNYRNIVLHDEPSRETIGVATREGDYRYLPWLGFIELRLARRIPGARPVKLQAEAVSPTEGLSSDWRTLEAGEHVQGCLLGRGVFGVLNKGFPRIV